MLFNESGGVLREHLLKSGRLVQMMGVLPVESDPRGQDVQGFHFVIRAMTRLPCAAPQT